MEVSLFYMSGGLREGKTVKIHSGLEGILALFFWNEFKG